MTNSGSTDLHSTPEWVSDAVFYQIFPDRFAQSDRVEKPGPLEPWDAPPTFNGFKGGDLLGIAEHLDYLTDLGVNALYLNPIFSSASNHRYHTFDYFQVDPLLGGNDAFRELLHTCHARGVRVVLDGVFNHSGRGFWPFHHILETGAGSPYVDWFYVDQHTLHTKGLRPYPSADEVRRMSEAAGPHRTGSDSKRELGYQAWWDLPALPKLNTNNPYMREHLMRASEFWLEFGIDGWRLDVAEEIDADFWRQWRRRVRAVNPDAFITAEIWREKPEWVTGDTFDSMMNYPLTEALLSFTAARYLDGHVVSQQHEYRDFVRPLDGADFARRLEHIMSMYRPEAIRTQLNLLDSHDTPRYVTVASGDRDSYRLASLAIFTLPGAPCVYYGSEVGVEGLHDPDCRRAFPWDESRWDAGLHAFVRAMAHTRLSNEALRRGSFRVLAAAGDAVAYERGDAVVVMNCGEDAAMLSIPGLAGRSLRAVELPGWSAPQVGSDGSVTVERRSGGILLG